MKYIALLRGINISGKSKIDMKELKKEIVHVKIKKSCTDILRAIVASILKIFDNYLENSTRKITIARWI